MATERAELLRPDVVDPSLTEIAQLAATGPLFVPLGGDKFATIDKADFETPEEAAEAWNKAVLELRGPGFPLNIIGENRCG